MSVLDNIPAAEQVRDETQAGANTAARVGGLFVSIINDTAQDINQVAAQVGDLPQQPFDDVEFYSTDNTGQDQWTADQTLNFKSKGVVVKALPVKVATASRSGFMSATDKTKLDNLPVSVVSGSDAAGDLTYEKDETNAVLKLIAVDTQTQLANVILYQVGSGNGDNNSMFGVLATKAGLMSSRQKNWLDLCTDGLILKTDAATRTWTVNLYNSGRISRGQFIEISVLATDEADIDIDIEVYRENGSSTGVQIPFTAGPLNAGQSETVSVDSLLDLAGVTGEYIELRRLIVTPSLSPANNAIVRVRILNEPISQQSGGTSMWYIGAEVSGDTSLVEVEGAKLGDIYLNSDNTSNSFGNVYQLRSVISGGVLRNTWIKQMNITARADLDVIDAEDSQDGYAHAYLSVTNGGVTTTTPDLMSPVNEVLQAVNDIMNPNI